jgi:methionyl-tRNA formyltransferase
MSQSKKIVIWCGNAANQRALANKIAARFEVVGIVIDKKSKLKRPPLVRRTLSALQDRLFFKTINGSWSSLQKKYAQQFPAWPSAAHIEVESINSEDAFAFTEKLSPDLVVVSGTGLVKSKMLSLKPSIGIINLHTGLSPYIKGGPNCTNWCIATAQYNKIGNTIMWINEGIDSGNIIASECTLLHDVKNLDDIQWQVMEHAHDLYIRAIAYLVSRPAPYNSVSQNDITKGQLYLTRMWNFSAKKKLLGNLTAFINNGPKKEDESLVTIGLNN